MIRFTPEPTEPCPCGSGQEYRSCCSVREEAGRSNGSTTPAGAAGVQGGTAEGGPAEGGPAEATPAEAAPAAGTWHADVVPFPPPDRGGGEGAPRTVAIVAVGDRVLSGRIVRDVISDPLAVADLLHDVLIDAIDTTGHAPDWVMARHEEVCKALRPRLEPYKTEVAAGAELHPLAALAAVLVRRRWPERRDGGAKPTCLAPWSWTGAGLPISQVREVARAAADFHAGEAWAGLDDGAPLVFDSGGSDPWYATALGRTGAVGGLALFTAPADRDRLRDHVGPGPFDPAAFTGRCLCLTLQHAEHLLDTLRHDLELSGAAFPDGGLFPFVFHIDPGREGLNRSDVENLVTSLDALVECAPVLRGPWEEGAVNAWLDPASGLVVRVTDPHPKRRFPRVMEPGEGMIHPPEDYEDPAVDETRPVLDEVEPPPMEGLDDLPEGVPSLKLVGGDEDDELIWSMPEQLTPGFAEGPGADPEAGLTILEPSARERQRELNAALHARFERWLVWHGPGDDRVRAAAIEVSRLLLAELNLPGGTPVRGMHERDLREFLYIGLPEEIGPYRDAPIHGGQYLTLLSGLPHFFTFLEMEEGIACPWTEPILSDNYSFYKRWHDFQRGYDGGWLDDWYEMLWNDLQTRAMMFSEYVSEGTWWLDMEVEPQDWGWDIELTRRWLLWREEVIASGVTDPAEVWEATRERQYEWERMPHPGLGGRTPMDAVQHHLAIVRARREKQPP